jgi:predicted permease
MWTRLRPWLDGVFRRPRVERDLADEVEFHLQQRAEHWVRQGLPPPEAARRARIEFGAVERHKEDCREALGFRLIDELGGDIVYGLRKMRAAPTFTIVAVSILAISIGANTAVFSVLEAVVLRMLPVERPQELRELSWKDRRDSPLKITYTGAAGSISGGAPSFAYPVYAHVRDRSTVFDELFLFDQRAIDIRVSGRAQRVPGLFVSGNFLRGLGVSVTIGRSIGPQDDRADAPAVAVLTYGFWQRVFGGDPSALGQPLAVNGTPAVIIGVTARAFDGVDPGSPIDVIVPVTTLLPINEARQALGNSRYWRYRVMGRVKAGVDDERVRTETQALFQQALPLDSAQTAPSELPRILVAPGAQGLGSLRRNYAQPLYLLMAMMSVVLLIACANVAGLLLTRATARGREMGVRLALGAGRARLMRQLLTESALLACAGGGLGIGLAFAIRGALPSLLSQGRAPLNITLGVSPWLVIFSIASCIAVALSCGMLPALRATRLGLSATQARTVPGGAAGTSRLVGGKALIAVQVALSLVLLVGAGLFMRTLMSLRAQAIGFDPAHVLLFDMDASASGYTDVRLHDFYESVLDRVTSIPAVQEASLSRYSLLSGGRTTATIVIPGEPKGQDEVRVHLHFVSPRHLETMGIPLLIGRDFTVQDREGAPRVALANQALARLLPGTGGPVGRQILYDQPDSPVEIVGVTGDARFATLREPAPPTLYLPYRQHPQRRMTFAARVAGNPMAIAAPIRRAISEIDPNVALLDIRTQETQIDTGLRQERVFAYVASGFAVLAIFLACLGIYGTLAHSVARRAPEIGLRMALGASRREVIYMVLRESLAPVVVGLVFGLAVVGATTRFVQSMLFGLTPHDPPTILLAGLGLIVSALLAAWLPSRRASHIDPMAALRCE